jgi:hypothetical protein
MKELGLAWCGRGLSHLELGFEGCLIPRQLVLDCFLPLAGVSFCVLAVGAFAPIAENVGRKALTVQLEALGPLAVAFLGCTCTRCQLHHLDACTGVIGARELWT